MNLVLLYAYWNITDLAAKNNVQRRREWNQMYKTMTVQESKMGIKGKADTTRPIVKMNVCSSW